MLLIAYRNAVLLFDESGFRQAFRSLWEVGAWLEAEVVVATIVWMNAEFNWEGFLQEEAEINRDA